MTLGEDSTITIGLGIVVLGCVWAIANKLARATARMDAADERDRVRKETIDDHEKRLRVIEKADSPNAHRRRSTDPTN